MNQASFFVSPSLIRVIGTTTFIRCVAKSNYEVVTTQIKQ